MKRSLLLVSLLFSVPAFANTFETYKAELGRAQTAVDAAEKRVTDLGAQSRTAQQKISSASGRQEFADDMARQRDANRGTMEECNKAVEECQAKVRELQAIIARKPKEATVTSTSGKFTVIKAEEPTPPAAPARVIEGPREAYAAQGSYYPRARRVVRR